MDNKLFNQLIDEQLDKCKDLMTIRQEEYASADRLSAFKRAAKLQGISPREALSGMMAKHTVSIYDMLHSNKDYPRDKWEEKITDHINYLLLLKCVLIEEHLIDEDSPIVYGNGKPIKKFL